jgi:predicted ATPase
LESLNSARKQEAKLWQLRAAASLVRLCRGEGLRTDAHDLLTSVYGEFTEGFDDPA